MAILADQIADQLRFYNSIDADVLESSFQTEYLLAMRTKDDLTFGTPNKITIRSFE